jgi:hypothetical protein
VRGYFLPRTTRGRAVLAAYLLVEALLGFASVAAPYPADHTSRLLGYLLMAPVIALWLPVVGALDARGVLSLAGTSTSVAVTLAILFAVGALGNACALTYLRSADGRY